LKDFGIKQRGHFPSAVVAVEVSGVWGGVWLHLGQIPNPERGLRLVPRVNLTKGLSDFGPLLRQVPANNFGGSVFQLVGGQGKVEMKPLVFSVAFLPQKPAEAIQITSARKSLSRVSDEKLKLVEAVLFRALKLPCQGQVAIDQPVWNQIKGVINGVVLARIPSVSERRRCLHTDAFFVRTAFKGTHSAPE